MGIGSTSIQLNDATLLSAISKAIFDTISVESREALLSTAIATLLQPERGARGEVMPSQIQLAFNRAVSFAVEKMAAEYCATPEVQAQLQTLLVETVNKALGLDDGEARSKLVSNMADAFCKGLTGGRY